MLLWIAFTASLAFAKAPSLTPSLQEFQAACIENRVGSKAVKASTSQALNKPAFMPVKALERLQSTFSFDRVLRAIQKMSKKELAEISSGTLPHNNGNSIYPLDRMITAIRYKGKLYIVDGHHRALISVYLGAKTIPVTVIADWSSKSKKKFFKNLKKQDLSYFYNLEGEWAGPGEFCDMIDDPLLYLARHLLRRVDLTYDPKTEVLEFSKVRGTELAIGLKLNRDVPFTEQEIARRLRARGVDWVKGDDLTLELLQEFLDILEDDRDSSRLAQLLLLERPTPVAELELEEVIRKHFQRVQCEYQMSGGDLD